MTPIADLHCDLLTYLANDSARTPFDSASRCSIPALIAGGVKLQTLAIFTENSHEPARKQAEIFPKIQKNFPEIEFLAAIENASGILSDHEPLPLILKRLEFFAQLPLLYISFTWNGENRFGGGAFAQNIGLKSDGKELLRLLHQKKIAVDFSHASDKLAYDILACIDQESLDIPVIASHSNCRKIHPQDRNLPDELILEIIRRKGLIGLNFVRHFIDDHSFFRIRDHAEHILKLGGENTLALGADFFAAEDLPPSRYGLHKSWFFEGFDHAGTLQKALPIIGEYRAAELNFRQFLFYRTRSQTLNLD